MLDAAVIMQCFYVHVHEQGVAPDVFGMISPDLQAVTAKVANDLREIVAGRAAAGRPEPDGWVEITDEEDRPLATISFADAITRH